MARFSKSFALCSLLMAFLFAYSAMVQFMINDQDWFIWVTLYTCALVVNLINGTSPLKAISRIANLTLWLGAFLFTKVVSEDHMNGLAGFWSLDLENRVVREKIGSGLVLISMLLQLEASTDNHEDNSKKELAMDVPIYVEYGMAALVGVSYGVSVVFFVFIKEDMK